jgi:cobalt-zinc-cadmium efflux system protein
MHGGSHPPSDRHDGHGHARGHSHEHSHGHLDGVADRAFAIGTALNAGFVVVELTAGIAVNSVALVADGVHNLGDVLGLLMAWGAIALGRRPPSSRRTYGWGRSSILAALANAALLLVATGGIVVEALRRLFSPEPVGAYTVIVVALAGIAVNGITAALFMRGRKDDLNVRAAFLHMAGDAAVSLGVVVAAVLIALTGWLRLDPLASLVVGLVIAASGWSVLRESVNLAMDGVPGRIAQEDVFAFLNTQPEVAEVHDLHIWGLSTTDTAMTAHLVIVQGATVGDMRTRLEVEMHERFGIGHATIQIETEEEAASCRLRSDEVV